MRTPYRVVWSVVLGIFGIAVIAYIVLRTNSPPDFERPALARIRNTAAVGGALAKFQHDNGHLPNQLSELFPKYLDHSTVRYLFPLDYKPVNRPGLDVSKAELDMVSTSGAFAYLGESGRTQDLILYERPNRWSVEKGTTNVMTVSSNFTRIQRAWDDVLLKTRGLNRARQQ